jgi:hypothetical protein
MGNVYSKHSDSILEEAALEEGWDACEKCGEAFENEPECPKICGLCENKMSKVIQTELNGRMVYIDVYEENGIIHASVRDVY